MAERLKDCPFCTATASPNGPVDIIIENDIDEAWVACAACDCRGPAVSYSTQFIGVERGGLLAACKMDAIELAVLRWNDAPRPVDENAAVTPNAVKMLAQMALTGDPTAGVHDEFDIRVDIRERAGQHDE